MTRHRATPPHRADRLLAAVLGAAEWSGISVALGRLIEAGLLGVTSSDPRLIVGLAAILVVAAQTAGYLPARRAAAIDPIVALRAD